MRLQHSHWCLCCWGGPTDSCVCACESAAAQWLAENDIIQSRSIVGKLMSSSLRIQCEKHSEEEGGPRCSAALLSQSSCSWHLSKYGVDTARMHRRAKEETHTVFECLSSKNWSQDVSRSGFLSYVCRLWCCRYGLVSGQRDGAAPAVRHPPAALPRSRERRDAGRKRTSAVAIKDIIMSQ